MNKKLLKVSLLASLVFIGATGISSCGSNNQVTPNPDGDISSDKNYAIWTGIENLTLSVGETNPDLLKGVSAKLPNGETLTVKIIEESSDLVDTSAPGTFIVYYGAYKGDKLIDDDTAIQLRTIVIEKGTYIEDASFDKGIEGWSGNGNGGTEISYFYNANEKAMEINVNKSGQTYWLNQVEYNGLEVKKDVTYEISLKAKSTNGRNIGVTLEVPSQGYRCIESKYTNALGLETGVNEYKELKFYYTAEADYTDVKFGLLLGRFTEKDDVPSTVLVDDIKITAMAKKANSTGITFNRTERYNFASVEALNMALPVTAIDANGNEVPLTRIGSLPKSFPENYRGCVFGEMWYHVDEEGNFSYAKRELQYK